MNRDFLRWLAMTVLGLAPLTAFADPGAKMPPPPIAISEPGIFSPYGYFPTHWRAYPAPPATLPQPVGAPAQVGTPVGRDFNVPKPILLDRSSTAARRAETGGPRQVRTAGYSNFDRVPVPHPASVAANPRRYGNQGFATLRSPMAEAPSPAPMPPSIAVPPIPDPPPPPPLNDARMQRSRSDDDVVRPAWPVIPPPKR